MIWEEIEIVCVANEGECEEIFLHNGPYAKLFKIIKLLTSRRLGAQCSKHASVLLI